LVKEKPENWNIKEGVYVIKPNQKVIHSKFLLFFLNSIIAKKQIENKIVGSPVMSIPMSELKKLLIPIPSLSEQERIVSILDKFDALVNNISIGLPAELKARRQQYEYYRNKLLTFKPIKN
jgi:type I restriction enzyme S subunit